MFIFYAEVFMRGVYSFQFVVVFIENVVNVFGVRFQLLDLQTHKLPRRLKTR